MNPDELPGGFLERQRRFLLLLLSSVGIAAAYGFGIRWILAGETAMGWLDILFASLAVVNLIWLYRGTNITLSALIAQAILLTLLTLLTIRDDKPNSGVTLWFYTFPLFSTFTLGWRRGGILSVVTGFLSAGLVYHRNAYASGTAHPQLLTARFFFSYLSVTLLTGFYDWVLDGSRRALAENRDNLRMVLSSLSDVVFSLDREGRFVKFFRPLGHEAGVDVPDDFVGKFYGEMLPPQAADPLRTALEKVKAGGQSVEFDYYFGAGEETRFFSAKVSPLKSPSDELLGFTVAARDVTVRRRLERDLLEAQQAARLGRLAGGVAHEINNPLAAVQSDLRVLQILAARLPPAPERGKMLDILARDREAVSRVSGIATAVREAYRPDRWHLVDLPKEIDLQLSLLKPEFKEGITVRKEVGPVPPVKAYGSDLGQILLNLMSNAVDAMGGKGELTVSAAPAPNGIALSVRDTGCGIAPEVLPLIFDPLFTTKEAGRGMGLGLSKSRELAARNNARLFVAETAPGRGTTFTLEISTGEIDAQV